MGQYSIKEIEALSGVKAHTIRIWEQRYKVVEPKRSATNIRYYSDEQLRKLLNFAVLNRNGYKISKLVALTPDELAAKLKEVEAKNSPFDVYINSMISAMVELNKASFNAAMNAALETYSFEKFCLEIVFPFLKRIGLLWSTDNIYPAQEHFASNLIKRKVIFEMERMLPAKNVNQKAFALFLPEGEFHELSLLISQYILMNHGHKTIYFGQSVPVKDLAAVLKDFHVDYLLTVILVGSSKQNLQNIIDEISLTAAKSDVWIAGAQHTFKHIDCPANVVFIDSLDHFVEKTASI